MENEKKLPKRKPPRWQERDYNTPGGYFITICTQDKRCILSRIVGTGVLDCPQIELTECGKIVDQYIQQLSAFYHHLSVESYVIMPNHIHLLLWIKENKNLSNENGQSRTPVPTNIERSNNTCSQFVSTLKRFCNKAYGQNIWQARYHDHVIRDRADLEEHVAYISENPLKWASDPLYA